MLKVQDNQMDFNDTDYLCSRLIPEDSFYHKFRDIVSPLIQDKAFSKMYVLDNGRPAIPPSLLAMATILQFYRDLSDREMERACMYDIEVKYALGLRIDDRPFDHSSLGDFRNRLLEHGKEKEVFDKILNKLVESGLIKRNEIQRIDATHIIADIAIPTVITLVKKASYEILKPLEKRHTSILEQIKSEIDLSEYTKEEVNKSDAGKEDRQLRKRRLVKVVNDAFILLKYAGGIKDDKILEGRVGLLRRILREQVEFNEQGEGRERDNKDKPKDVLISPIDPDARYGAKSKTKKFVGYKANITEEIGNRFITNVKAIPGNQLDGKTMVDTITEQKEYGIKPEKVIGDSAYSDGAYRESLKKEGVKIVAPQRIKNNATKGVYPKSMFTYDREKQKLICPEGVEGSITYYDHKKKITAFQFSMSACQKCPRKVHCTKSKDGRRTVGISEVQDALFEAERYSLTDEFKTLMKLRQAIEGKISELTRYHGLRRARYRGLKKLNLQCYFTTAAVNIKRWIKIILERIQAPPVLNVDLTPV